MLIDPDDSVLVVIDVQADFLDRIEAEVCDGLVERIGFLALSARFCDVPVIASGGVSSLDDLRAIAALVGIGVEGAIVGKALYAQAFTLEEALAVSLFHREGGHLRLTSYGSALQPSIAAAFDSIAEATTLLTRQKAEGELVVSCGPALASFWLIPHLASFTERHPGIRFTLIASNDDRGGSSAEVDVAIRYGNGPWPDRHVQLWTTMTLFPVCSPTLINAKPLRDVADLASHTLLPVVLGGEQRLDDEKKSQYPNEPQYHTVWESTEDEKVQYKGKDWKPATADSTYEIGRAHV